MIPFFLALLISMLEFYFVEAVLPYPLFKLPINDHLECVDYSSDCFERRGLCKNEAFKDFMRLKCARTCRICGESAKESDNFDPIIVDKPIQRHMGNIVERSLNPSVVKEWSKFLALSAGSSFNENYQSNCGGQNLYDCLDHLMNVDANTDLDTDDYAANSDEYLSESVEHQASTIMPPSAILQPPPSYSLPPSISEHNSVPSTFHRQRTCQDHAPNCFYLKSLCYNKFYRPIMEKNCRKTCNYCMHKKATLGKARWSSGIEKRPPHSYSWHVNGGIQTEQCRNKGLDCDDKFVKFNR